MECLYLCVLLNIFSTPSIYIVSLIIFLLATAAFFCLLNIYRLITTKKNIHYKPSDSNSLISREMKRTGKTERTKCDGEAVASSIEISKPSVRIPKPDADYSVNSEIDKLIEKIEKKRRLHEKEYTTFLKNLKEGSIVGYYNYAMVVGCYYRSRKARKEASMLKKGDFLVLKAEPNNKADCHAVSVYTYSNLKVGYIEAIKAWEIQKKLLRGVPVKCHVVKSEVWDYGGSIHVGLFPCMCLPKQPVFSCYPCDDEEHVLERVKSENYDNPYILSIYKQNLPELIDLAEKEFDYIYSLPTRDFMRYIHDHSIITDFACNCDNCRWLTHTIYSMRLVYFDIIRIKYSSIDQFDIRFSSKVFVANWLPFNNLYKEAKQAEEKGEFDLAIQLYKDLLNSICSISIYYSALRSIKKYLVDIRAYDEYISFCRLIVEKVNKQFVNLTTCADTSKIIDYARVSEQKTSDLLLKEYSYPISKRIALVNRSISSIVSNLEKVDSTTPELKIKYLVWKHGKLNDYLNHLLEQQCKEMD